MPNNNIDKIVIGNSDYSRKQIEDGIGWYWGDSPFYLLDTIRAVEREGYEVKFETSLLRRIFGVAKYKVVGYKTIQP